MLEPIFKLTLPILGIFDEIVPWDPLFAPDGTMNHTPIHGYGCPPSAQTVLTCDRSEPSPPPPPPYRTRRIQHALMYIVFMLSGLADLLTVWCDGARPARARWPGTPPRRSDDTAPPLTALPPQVPRPPTGPRLHLPGPGELLPGPRRGLRLCFSPSRCCVSTFHASPPPAPPADRRASCSCSTSPGRCSTSGCTCCSRSPAS